MHKIHFGNRSIACQHNANLRLELMRASLPLYNGIAAAIHCRGLGTCGTCAVRIEGRVSEMTAVEKWRLSFPPHRQASNVRLACQCRVLGDLRITKGQGLWGQRFDEPLLDRNALDD